jgi:DNA-binding XRE family transcriptional regulator
MNQANDLKEYRINHGLSQMDMAAKLGVSYNCYILWERGLVETPSEENRVKIGKLLKKK